MFLVYIVVICLSVVNVVVLWFKVVLKRFVMELVSDILEKLDLFKFVMILMIVNVFFDMYWFKGIVWDKVIFKLLMILCEFFGK